jgi:hypothetical protein
MGYGWAGKFVTRPAVSSPAGGAHAGPMSYEKELLEAISTLTDVEKSQLLFALMKEDPAGLDFLDSRKWSWEQYRPTRDQLEASSVDGTTDMPI